MFESRHEPVAPRKVFTYRLIKSFGLGIFLIFVVLTFGMLGYHYFEGLTWVDSFLNAAMILSSMGLAQPLMTTGGKIFVAFYALFSGLIFITVIAIVFAPFAHRFIHTFQYQAPKHKTKHKR